MGLPFIVRRQELDGIACGERQAVGKREFKYMQLIWKRLRDKLVMSVQSHLRLTQSGICYSLQNNTLEIHRGLLWWTEEAEAAAIWLLTDIMLDLPAVIAENMHEFNQNNIQCIKKNLAWYDGLQLKELLDPLSPLLDLFLHLWIILM